MDTLYDLLGALPSDDAEDLRAAFRRAAKGVHPDINPGDPDAALKFRQIVRAHEILGDVEQRAAYDHLLDLARLEQELVAKQAFAEKVYKLASSVMGLAALSAAAVGSYALFLHLSASTLAPSSGREVAAREPAAIADAAVAEQAVPDASTVPPEAQDRDDIPQEAIVPAAASMPAETADAPAGSIGRPLDIAPREAKGYWARGISAYRSGDLNGALADFDQAIQFDPKFARAYIDRSIVFYRLRKFDRAFADVSHAKRLEKASHSAGVSPNVKKKPPQESTAKPAPPRRTAEIDLSRQEGATFLMHP